jgi:hypothetical protein
MIERRPRTLPALQHGDHRRLLRFGTARLGGPPWSLAGPLAGAVARRGAGLDWPLARGPGLEIDADRFESFQGLCILYEDQTNPNGRLVGSAAWRIEQVAPGPGQKPDIVVRAEIEIPEQKVLVRLSLRRNDDKQLPASHAVEIVFTLPPDFPHGGISNIPGILMKQGATTRGVPLSGVAVKVTANFFLIGLSSVDVEMQRNMQLLKERSWFGKRAIIAIEKGTPGERAFTEAFAIWGQ